VRTLIFCHPHILSPSTIRLVPSAPSAVLLVVALDARPQVGVDDLAQITLMSDGASVYECTSPDEVVDLVQGGQGVFGIAVGRVWREIEGTLSEMPTETLEGAEAVAVHEDDELAARRRARNAG
jgi:hypothetical protein